MKCLLDWFGVTYWPNRLGPARRNIFFYELDEEEGAEDDGVEGSQGERLSMITRRN